MALSSSLFTGTSGLINMGNVMQVVSNNIANSNTVGFKKGVSSFADTLNQNIATQSGVGQIGRGMAIGEVSQNFNQGSFETTGNVTDLSIGGDGFFIVSNPDQAVELYTRAGNFHFDEDGQFVNPNNYIVQGWKLDNKTGDNVGAIGDIVMDSFTSPPEKSTKITAITNLDADVVSKADVMANYWNADEETYIDGTLYEYQTVVKVYDSLGSPHDVTIYYDKKSDSEWEYMIAANPEEDKRELLQATSAKGLLAKGTIAFSQSSGDIIDITMSELTGRIGNFNSTGINEVENAHFTIKDTDTMALDGYGFALQFNGTGWDLTHPLFDQNGENIIDEILNTAVNVSKTITPGTNSLNNDLGDYTFTYGPPWAYTAGSNPPPTTPAIGAGSTATQLTLTLASGTVIQYDFAGAGAGAADSVSFTVDPAATNSDAIVNYPDASIVSSDNQNIYIKLNNLDDETDLKISLDKIADLGDTLSFDINAANDIHVQGVDGSQFVNETANGNTEIVINDPSVMTVDSSNISVTWYPDDTTWRWGNPVVAAANDDLIATPVLSGAGAVPPSDDADGDGDPWNDLITYSNAPAMDMYVENLQVMYDGTDWDWNMPVKSDDFPENPVLASMGTATNPTLTISSTSPGTGAFAARGNYLMTFTFGAPSTWAMTTSPTVPPGVAGAIISGDDNGVTFTLNDGTTASYTFSTPLTSAATGGTLAFTIDPTPPEVYPDASIIATGTGNLDISFNSDLTPDIQFDMITDATIAFAANDAFTFTVDPDSPPEEYSSATLTGDQDRAIIDLDGSGNEGDDDDIVFQFTDPLDITGFEQPSIIEFNISGSTAWKEIGKDEIKETGYFSFTTDFLGGDVGSTENKIEFNIGAEYDGVNFQNESMATTQYAKPSTTVFQNADGYAAGDLEGVDIAINGTITGIYSNGELIPLFRVGLAKFLNNNGLFNAGGNLFRETRDSGDAITNRPGENGLGTLSPSSLEMSNVDISEEFVKMIVTQRGFQANSKTITTVDDMMNTVIGMKR